MSQIEFVGSDDDKAPSPRHALHKPRTARNRVVALLSTLALVLGGLLAASFGSAGPASAAAIQCHTLSKHYAIGSGSVPIHVAYTDMHVTVCTNGSEITSERDSSSSNETGPGTAAGFQITFNSPYQTSFKSGGFNGGEVGVSAKGRLRDCLPKLTVFCSDGYNYSEHVHIDMLNAINYNSASGYKYLGGGKFSLAHRIFQATWSHASTTTKNGVTFH